jgi:hypothetical protein
MKKRTDRSRSAVSFSPELSGRDNVLSLRSFVALDNGEFDTLSFLEGAIALRADRAEVNKHVVPVVAGDETVPLGVVEPLDGSDLTICHQYPSFTAG